MKNSFVQGIIDTLIKSRSACKDKILKSKNQKDIYEYSQIPSVHV